jgi:hypothetical protein
MAMGAVKGQAATLQVEMVCLDELVPAEPVALTAQKFGHARLPATWRPGELAGAAVARHAPPPNSLRARYSARLSATSGLSASWRSRSSRSSSPRAWRASC